MKWNPTKALRDWLEARFELEPVVRLLRENLTKPVPAHVNWLFTLGSVLAALLAVQLFTGVLLMVHYKPSGQEAFQSVQHITYDVPLGWLIRSAHNWGSHLIVVLALLHLARVLVYGGYKKPRELTWGVGVALLAIILGFGFTGYLLPWDQVAYWGTVVATEAPASIPVVGPLTREFMIGGTEVADPTLGRFYVVHVILLPFALIALVGLHLLLIRYHGISPLSGTDQPETGADEIRRQGGKQVESLEDEAHLLLSYLGAVAVSNLGDFFAVDPDAPASRLQQPSEDVQQSRFAAPTGAHESHKLALLQDHVDPSERGYFDLTYPIHHLQIFDYYQVLSLTHLNRRTHML